MPAIIITILALELKVPHGEDLATLNPLLSVFLAYLLSCVCVAIGRSYLDHVLRAYKRISGTAIALATRES